MTNAYARAIVASAYNVCGPQTGAAATPAAVFKLNRNVVLQCMAEYSRRHDGSLYTAAGILEARDLLAG